jgi:ABC-2 type transport system ATP-binding protein
MLVYEVEHLTKIYPKQPHPANDDISLTIEQGEFFGMLGANGAGKTTLIKQMANVLAPTSGSIRLFGEPLDSSALYVPRHLGYMPQLAVALNRLTVAEALYFPAHLRGMSAQDARQERDRLIELLDLGALRDQIASKISGGQRRLVLLGTALAAGQPVIILDEPTNDLDPQHRRLVWDVLRTTNREKGTTIILVTHNVVEAERVIQRVAIMSQGKLIAVGRPGTLKSELNHQLRLEMVFAPDCPPQLPPEPAPRQIMPGRWQIMIDRDAASKYIEILNHDTNIEDFSLTTATLEDLYMSLTESL